LTTNANLNLNNNPISLSITANRVKLNPFPRPNFHWKWLHFTSDNLFTLRSVKLARSFDCLIIKSKADHDPWCSTLHVIHNKFFIPKDMVTLQYVRDTWVRSCTYMDCTRELFNAMLESWNNVKEFGCVLGHTSVLVSLCCLLVNCLYTFGNVMVTICVNIMIYVI